MVTREHDQSRYQNMSTHIRIIIMILTRLIEIRMRLTIYFNDQFDELLEYLASVFYQSNKEFCHVI